MGYEPLTKWVVLLVLFIQIGTAYALRNTHPTALTFVVVAYVIGATANHNLFLAIHEITHNLAFQGVKQNKFFSIIANLPIGIPYAMAFKVCSCLLPMREYRLTASAALPSRAPQATRREWHRHRYPYSP